MLTADRFHALADELAAASPADRAAILNLPKSTQPITLAEAAELTGYPETTLLDYLRPSRRKKMGPKAIPPMRDDGTWPAGELARWTARVPNGGDGALPRRPGQPRTPDRQIIPVARAILAAEHGITNPEALRDALAERGVTVGRDPARRIWAAVKPPPEDWDPGPLPDSLRPDGLLYGRQLARWARVSPPAITRQVERGKLTPAAWTRDIWNVRKGTLRHYQEKIEIPVFDPARVTLPGGTLRAPVDKDPTEGSET